MDQQEIKLMVTRGTEFLLGVTIEIACGSS